MLHTEFARTRRRLLKPDVLNPCHWSNMQEVVVLHTEAARAATSEILELHSIPAPVSRDMAGLLPPAAAQAVVAAHAATAAPPPPPALEADLVVRRERLQPSDAAADRADGARAA